MTQKLLKKLLHYNEDTGVFTWKVQLARRAKVGDIAAPTSNGRYKYIGIYGKRYASHKLAWLYVYGIFPNCQVDHIDQNTRNNKIDNLRLASNLINHQNMPKRRDNTSGVTGVSFDKLNKKWVVRIKDKHGTYKNKGRFKTIKEATEARNKALKEIGYHFNHGQRDTQSQYRTK